MDRAAVCLPWAWLDDPNGNRMHRYLYLLHPCLFGIRVFNFLEIFASQPMSYSGSSPGNYGPPGSGGNAGGGNSGGGNGPPGPSTPIMPSPQDSSNSGGENIYTMMKPDFPMGGPPGGPGNGNVGPVGTGPDGVPIGSAGGGGPGANGGGPQGNGGGPGGAAGERWHSDFESGRFS